MSSLLLFEQGRCIDTTVKNIFIHFDKLNVNFLSPPASTFFSPGLLNWRTDVRIWTFRVLKLDLKLQNEKQYVRPRVAKKPIPILSYFVDLFSVLSYFQAKEQKFSRLRRNCTFLALTNGTFKELTNNMISM